MTIYVPMKLLLVLSPLACAIKHNVEVAEASDAVSSSQLPGVDSLLGDVAHIAQGIGSEAAQMRVQIEHLQAQNAKKLQLENAAYDHRLKEQEKGNLRLQRKNAASASKLVSLYKENQKMMQELASAKRSNKERAEELSALKKQMRRGAQEVTGDMQKMRVEDAATAEYTEGTPTGVETSSSLLETGVETSSALLETSEELLPASSGLSFLEMKMEAAPKGVDTAQIPAGSNVFNIDPAVEALLTPESEQAESEEVLSADEAPMQTPVVSVAAEDVVDGTGQAQSLMSSVSQGFGKLESISKRAEQKMKQVFQQAYKAGKRRGDAMIQQSKVLELKFHSLERGRKKIKKALDAERKVRLALENRVRDLGSFLGSLQRVVTAPLNNVPNALKAAQAWHESPVSPA